jgi:hypothetical protein
MCKTTVLVVIANKAHIMIALPYTFEKTTKSVIFRRPESFNNLTKGLSSIA